MLVLLVDSLTKAWPILLWSGILIVVLVVLFLVIGAIRKAMEADEPDDAAPFSLEDLRRMHRAGHLTDEQFAKARAQIIAMVQGGASGDPAGDGVETGESSAENDSTGETDQADNGEGPRPGGA